MLPSQRAQIYQLQRLEIRGTSARRPHEARFLLGTQISIGTFLPVACSLLRANNGLLTLLPLTLLLLKLLLHRSCGECTS